MASEQPGVARDFLGISLSMGDTVIHGDAVLSEPNFQHGTDHSASIVNASLRLTNVAMEGMRNSSRSEAACTMQQFLPLRSSLDESFKEQIAENLPERPLLHFIHHRQMQDLGSCNQKIGLYAQVRGQESAINSSGQVREEHRSSIPISGGFLSSATRAVISSSKPDQAMAASGPPAPASKQRLPSPCSTTDVQRDAPLTIFYAGSVNVFNRISAEQAQAIMLFASAGNVQRNPVEQISAGAAARRMNGTVASSPQNKALTSLDRRNQAVANQQQGKSDHVNMLLTTTNMQLDIKNLNIPAPSSEGPPDPPVVPTALPHARKASLARFLEKRRERAYSNCPYRVRQEESSLLEERLSSSNDKAHCNDRVDKRKGVLMLSWMQSDATAKDQ